MKNKHINKGVVLMLVFLTLSSCKKFVQVDMPSDQITGPIVFENLETANAALGNIYQGLRSDILTAGNTNGLSVLLGQYTDELKFTATSVTFEQGFYQNSLLPTNTAILKTWNTSYNLIFSANSIIEGLDNSSNIPIADKNRIKGEALFLRAFIHFHLVNLFGSIPYVTTTDYRVNTKPQKMTSDAVYASTIADLKQAKILIPDIYTNVDRTHPNKGCVSAMLARVYLYTKDWANAEVEASEVMGNGQYAWQDNIDQVFLKISKGTLWQFSVNQGGTRSKNTAEAETFIIGNSQRPMNDKLYDAFASNDLRKTHWIGTAILIFGNTVHYPYKYKQLASATINTECSIVLRLEEQYLIRAEARAMQDNISGAQADLNRTRIRAGLGTTDADTRLELIDAIINERRFEFFTEHGHRFFDLKRTGKINTELSYKSNWNSTDVLWPLPDNELKLNPNLKPQNPGYPQ